MGRGTTHLQIRWNYVGVHPSESFQSGKFERSGDVSNHSDLCFPHFVRMSEASEGSQKDMSEVYAPRTTQLRLSEEVQNTNKCLLNG